MAIRSPSNCRTAGSCRCRRGCLRDRVVQVTGHPAYGTLRQVTPAAAVLLQDNPGPMTLDGTNTWLLRAPGSSGAVIVDPGQTDDTHVERVLAAAPAIDLVLVTHGHFDHSQAAAAVHERTGAPVRAIDPEHCRGGRALTDGEVIEAAGLLVR